MKILIGNIGGIDMVYCSKCGKQMDDSATFCSGCGAPLQNQINYAVPDINKARKPGFGVAALVLGIVGVLAWIIPIIGLPVGIIALVLGIIGLKKSSKGMSIVGIVLGIICLVLTIINSAIGAYQGYHGEAWFQKGSNNIEENVSDNQPSGKQETNVFTLRDSDGNILMTGGIKSAEATMVDNGDEIKKAVVQIEFDDESTKTFADITTNNIGNTIGIYLNDEMIANPRVMCAITEGSCQIEVDTYEQAQVLSEALEKCK